MNLQSFVNTKQTGTVINLKHNEDRFEKKEDKGKYMYCHFFTFMLITGQGDLPVQICTEQETLLQCKEGDVIEIHIGKLSSGKREPRLTAKFGTLISESSGEQQQPVQQRTHLQPMPQNNATSVQDIAGTVTMLAMKYAAIFYSHSARQPEEVIAVAKKIREFMLANLYEDNPYVEGTAAAKAMEFTVEFFKDKFPEEEQIIQLYSLFLSEMLNPTYSFTV